LDFSFKISTSRKERREEGGGERRKRAAFGPYSKLVHVFTLSISEKKGRLPKPEQVHPIYKRRRRKVWQNFRYRREESALTQVKKKKKKKKRSEASKKGRTQGGKKGGEKCFLNSFEGEHKRVPRRSCTSLRLCNMA